MSDTITFTMSGVVHDRMYWSYQDDEGNPQRVRIFEALKNAKIRNRGKSYSATVTVSREDAAEMAEYLDVGWAIPNIDDEAKYEYRQCVKIREKILELLQEGK